MVNNLGETGRPVDQEDEYHSVMNPHFLTIEEVVTFSHLAGIL